MSSVTVLYNRVMLLWTQTSCKTPVKWLHTIEKDYIHKRYKNTFKSMAFGYKNFVFEIFSQNKIIPPPPKKRNLEFNNNNLESRITFADVTQFTCESPNDLNCINTLSRKFNVVILLDCRLSQNHYCRPPRS